MVAGKTKGRRKFDLIENPIPSHARFLYLPDIGMRTGFARLTEERSTGRFWIPLVDAARIGAFSTSVLLHSKLRAAGYTVSGSIPFADSGKPYLKAVEIESFKKILEDYGRTRALGWMTRVCLPALRAYKATGEITWKSHVNKLNFLIASNEVEIVTGYQYREAEQRKLLEAASAIELCVQRLMGDAPVNGAGRDPFKLAAGQA